MIAIRYTVHTDIHPPPLFICMLVTLFSRFLIMSPSYFFPVSLLKILLRFFVSVVEYCGVESRTVPLLVVMVSYSLASLLLPGVAYLLPSWHYLGAMATAAVIPVLCCYR